MAANSGDKSFSAFYVAGKDWYSALAFVYDYGGQIATSVERQVDRHARHSRGRSRA